MKLMREVLKLKEHSRVSISAVFYFIDYLLRLPDDLTHQLTAEMRPILEEERKHMVQYERDHLSPTLADLAAIERKEAMERGLKLGEKIGEVKGEEKGKKNIALTLLDEGFDIDYIAKLTKLSVAEVVELKKTLQ